MAGYGYGSNNRGHHSVMVWSCVMPVKKVTERRLLTRFDRDDAARCVRIAPSKIESKRFLAVDV